MLTKAQKEYLANMPSDKANKIVKIEPYNPKTKLVASRVIKKIKTELPNARLRFMGASALKISGLNDVDIWVFYLPKDREEYLKKLTKIFKGRIGEKNSWKIVEDGVPVSIKLSNPNDLNIKGQLMHFKLFKKDVDLLKSYELMKKSFNGKTYREYATAKKDFLMRVYCWNNRENLKNLKYLEKIGAAITNSHVIKPSGGHAKNSFTKYKLYPNVDATFYVAKTIARQFRDYGIDVVVGPATGGDILSELVSYYLGKFTKNKVCSFYVKKSQGSFILRDNSNKLRIRGKRVLLVDDTLDTGKTAKDLVRFINILGANVVGLATICTRNGILAEELGVAWSICSSGAGTI